MTIIGLTGNPGTGKSTVAAMFQKLGAAVFDSDRAVHDLLERKGACYRAVVREFGERILNEDKGIDRRKLAEVVFNDGRARKKLERIVHPYVGRAMSRWVARPEIHRKKVAVMEVPLLFEAGFDKWVDGIVVVRANRSQQIARLKGRLGLSRREALSRIAAQMPLKEKIRRADYVVDNRSSRDAARQQVLNIWKELTGGK